LFGFQFCCYFSFPFCVQFPEIPPPRLYLVRSFLLSFLFLLPFGKVEKISMSVCLKCLGASATLLLLRYFVLRQLRVERKWIFLNYEKAQWDNT
jgi:hypothetical protein